MLEIYQHLAHLGKTTLPRMSKQIARKRLDATFGLQLAISELPLDCKTVGFFLKISKEIGKAWRTSLTRAKRASDCSRLLEYAKIRTVLQSKLPQASVSKRG